MPELGKFGQKGARGDGSDAGYTAEQVVLGPPEGAAADDPIQIAVDVVELALQPTDVLLDALADRGRRGNSKPVLFGAEHVQNLAAPGDQSTQFLPDRIGQGARLGPDALGKGGDPTAG